jgi:hypothetical protein
MPQTYKVLGQNNPAASGSVDLYTVPSGYQAVASTISVCNLGQTCQYRIAVRPSGESISDKNYIIYNNYVNTEDSILLTLGISLGSTDVVSVYSTSNDVSFSLFGVEIS